MNSSAPLVGLGERTSAEGGDGGIGECEGEIEMSQWLQLLFLEPGGGGGGGGGGGVVS